MSLEKEEILEQYRKEVDVETHRRIRELWKKHSVAEDNRDIPGLMSTLTSTCRYELVNTSIYWDGHAGATQFYLAFLGGMPDVTFDLQRIVIGPQGVFEEAILRGTHKGKLLGYEGTGNRVESAVGILFPWDEKQKLFAGERIYLDLPSVFGKSKIAT